MTYLTLGLFYTIDYHVVTGKISFAVRSPYEVLLP